MKNFFSILKLAAGSRWRIVQLVICSLAIGILWGANIGIFFPFLEAVFYGETIPESLERKVADSERLTGELAVRLKALEAGPQNIDVEHEIALVRDRIAAQRQQATQYRKLIPKVRAWLPQTAFGTIVCIATVMFIAGVIRGLLMAWNDVLVAQLTQRALFQVRSKYYRHLLNLELGYFSEDRSPRIMSRFTHDIHRVGEGVSAVLSHSLREPFKMIACLIGAAIVSWQLLVLSLILIPPGLLVLRALGRMNRSISRTGLSAIADLYSGLSEALLGIRVVKGSASEGYERRKFHGVLRGIQAKLERAAVVRALIKPVVELLGVSVVAISIVAGGYLVLNHQTTLWGFTISSQPLSPAALLVFFAMLLGATDPLRKIAGLSISFNRSAAAADRVCELFAREPQICDVENPVAVDLKQIALEIDKVSFRYRKQDHKALEKVSLQIAPGECIALIGANGSGKSTLLSLLLRFYDPSHGRISVNGVDLKEIEQRTFRRRVGVIPQQPFLFDDTVENNIRYGSTSASFEEVQQAARASGAAEFIERELDEGYQTIVGEGGNRLSGGQAQKIALARAILRDPALLILDEATSQLDALAETELMHRLTSFIEGRTTIMVTHRPTLLALATRIVLLDSGKIVEVGTHDELLSRSPLYRGMVFDASDSRAA